MPPPPIVLIMGVAGAGKTTVGRRLADTLGWSYFEADDFHSAENKAKMAQGTPLNDADRAPWLAAIRAAIEDCSRAHRPAVFTCSALKESYRQKLTAGLPHVRLVYLSGDRALLQQRIEARAGHYMKPGMLDSQLATLEPPHHALTLDVRYSPEELVEQIRRNL